MREVSCPFCGSKILHLTYETDSGGLISRCAKCSFKGHPHIKEDWPMKVVKEHPFMRLLHVGGRQDYIGPATCLMLLFEDALDLSVCEADLDATNAGLTEAFDKRFKCRVVTLPNCLANTEELRTFYINRDADASSLFRPDPDASDYNKPGVHWGRASTPVKETVIRTTTVDDMVAKGLIYSPDFLSLDAQGAELSILMGACQALSASVIGVVTEVEFTPLYKDQPLFADSDRYLREHGFRLVYLLNMEHWWPSSAYPAGAGMLVAAEAVYLKDYRSMTWGSILPRMPSLARLIGASIAFEQFSYASEILQYLARYYRREWEEYVNSAGITINLP